MKYYQCLHCSHFLEESEKYCPNCGTRKGRKTNEISESEKSFFHRKGDYNYKVILSFAILAVIAAVIITFVYLCDSCSNIFDYILTGILSIGLIVLAAIAGAVIGIIAGAIVGFLSWQIIALVILVKNNIKYFIRKRHFKNHETLQKLEKNLNEKLNRIKEETEINKKIQQSNIKKLDKSELILSQETLFLGLNPLLKEKRDIEQALNKISLIRFQNRFKPIYFNNDSLKYEQCELKISQIKELLKDVNSFKNETNAEKEKQLQNLSAMIERGIKIDDALSYCESSFSEQNDYIEQNIDNLNKLREDLVMKKATISVSDISYFDTEKYNEVFDRGIEELEITNQLLDLDSFITGLNKIENEYYRLKGEDEVSKSLEL